MSLRAKPPFALKHVTIVLLAALSLSVQARDRQPEWREWAAETTRPASPVTVSPTAAHAAPHTPVPRMPESAMRAQAQKHDSMVTPTKAVKAAPAERPPAQPAKSDSIRRDIARAAQEIYPKAKR